MTIKINTQFLLDKEKGKDDAKLRYRIKWNDNKSIVAFNVGYRVDIGKWSKDTQRCKNNTTHGNKKVPASNINRRINKFEQIVEDIFTSYEALKTIPTKEEFRLMFNTLNGKVTNPLKSKSFFDYFNDFMQETGRANQWSDATYKKYNTVRQHLLDFSYELDFSSFNENGLVDYVYFLKDERNMRNSSILKHISFLKCYLKWAKSKEYTSENAYTSFTPKLKTNEKKIIFLDWKELMTVYNFDIPSKHTGLTKVRDVFCFCCFTSLRYSDVANLKKSNVFDEYISITTVKTADSLKIELNDYSKAILNKYKNESFANNLALPVISNQKMNDELKDLGKLCGINTQVIETYYKGNKRYDDVYPKYELLSTHAGRRTFICNALMLGIPAQVVMKWTGHSDYKAMKPYIDVADRTKSEAMNLFNKKSPL